MLYKFLKRKIILDVARTCYLVSIKSRTKCQLANLRLNGASLLRYPLLLHVPSFYKLGRSLQSTQSDDEYAKKNLKRVIIAASLVYAAATLLLVNEDYITWEFFETQLLTSGEIEYIHLYKKSGIAEIAVKAKDGMKQYYTMKVLEPEKFAKKLRRSEEKVGIPITDAVLLKISSSTNTGTTAINILTMAIIFPLLLVLVSFILYKGSRFKINDIFSQFTRAKFLQVDSEYKGSRVTFKDVAGLKEAKIEIMEFVEYLKAPNRFKNLGAKIPRGALLLGPPGCGKTLLARAVANEADVPFLVMAGPEFVEVIGGLGASRVRDLFAQAKERAPCIIYIDEIDAIGKKRGSGGSDAEEEQTLNQLLVEMDGIETQKNVIVMAATNRVDILDKALLRPGRFDRHITIDYPTLIERQETFDLYLKKLSLEGSPSQYSTWLAQLSPGMTGADINNVCNEAAIHAGTNGKKIVDRKDLDYAMEKVIAGSAKKSAVMSPAEREILAYHESGHALIGWLLPTTDALLRVSIVPRISSSLGFSQYQPNELKLFSNEQLFENMCVALGGRVAEAVTFNKVTTGAVDDLRRVTKLAYEQVRSFGMNDQVGCISFAIGEDGEMMSKPYSKYLASIIDQESRKLIAQAHKRTEEIISSNSTLLKKLAEALIRSETLTYKDIEALIGPPPHGQKNKTEVKSWESIQVPNNDQVE